MLGVIYFAEFTPPGPACSLTCLCNIGSPLALGLWILQQFYILKMYKATVERKSFHSKKKHFSVNDLLSSLGLRRLVQTQTQQP